MYYSNYETDNTAKEKQERNAAMPAGSGPKYLSARPSDHREVGQLGLQQNEVIQTTWIGLEHEVLSYET